MGRLPGNKSRAEARSLGDNVVSGTRTRRRSQERSPLPPVPLPCLCCSLLPQCCANAQASAHLTPLLAPLRSSRTRLRRGPPYAPALRHPSACPPPDLLLCRPTMVMRRTWEEPAPQILTPMLPAVPVCPPTSPSSLVHWANLLLPLRTRLPSLCSLTSRGRRPAGGVRRPVPRSQARPPPEVHAEPPPSRLRDEPRLLWGCAPRGPPVPIRPRPDGTRYCPPLP